MKKNIRMLLIGVFLVLLLLPLSAIDHTTPGYKQVAEPFFGTNIRLNSMGGAGLGVKGAHDSYLLNPANLAKSGFKLSLPAVTMTVHNPRAILESGAIDDFQKGGEANLISGATKFLSTIKQNYGDLITTDISTTFTIAGFGLSIEAQERLLTYNPTSTDFTKVALVAQVTTAATLGFGMNFRVVPNILDIDLGVSAKAVYKAYLGAVGANTIIGMMGDGSDPKKTLLNETPLVAGWAIPISAGMNLNFPFDLRASVVARNLNGKYRMTKYASVDSWTDSLFKKSFGDGPENPAKTGEWEMETPWALDLGIAWTPSFFNRLLEPSIALDLVDVVSIAGNKGEDLTRAFFEQTRVGVSLKLLRFLNLRYGINKGYHSIGAGIDLMIFHIDAAYYTQEYGKNLGDKPIDALSIRISIGSR